jgi:cyclopropane fatty-acyl-phospholipid synthase-like methyltransferase
MTSLRPSAKKSTDSIERYPLIKALRASGVSCNVVLPDGNKMRFGSAPPAFTAVFNNERVLTLPANERALGTAYINGDIDLEGDMLAVLDLRDNLRFGTTPWQMMKFALELFALPSTKVNRKAINSHYTLGDDFYLTFIDKRYRFYSHCIFHDDQEALEEAAEHKLESMWNSLGLKPGMRLLDIGGGWGGVAEYCSPRGVHVTSVTLVDDSANYMRTLFKEKNLNADVMVGDFLDFESDLRFDHAVIYGVIEHIPNYARFCDRVWRHVKPGGRLYLDASATKEKFAISPITRKHTWSGHHSFFSLPDMIREQLLHGFEIIETKRETRDYELTITHWANRFEEARDEIIRRWGDYTYRTFRIFLWGGAHAFRTNRLQAYRLVAERRVDAGPRPGKLRRTASFLGSLVS